MHKIVYSHVGDRPEALAEALRFYLAMANVEDRILGRFNAKTDYSIEALDEAHSRFAIVGRQRYVTILDSMFHRGGVLSPLGSEVTSEMRRDLAARLREMESSAGLVADLIGFGNLVLIEECDHPVLIDNIPLKPDLDPAFAAAVSQRIATLETT